jgi:putative membrane protein
MTEAVSYGFWHKAIEIHGSALPRVSRRVLFFGVFALAVYLVNDLSPPHIDLGISVAPYEFGGAVLGLLLVLRTNAGYERWWEARKLWGAIVNQSRNLAITALAGGPDDPAWRDRFVRRAAAFAHVARHSLRGERVMPEVVKLLGGDEAARVVAADHMPSFLARALAEDLRDGRERLGMDSFVFLQADRERALLIDHVGACERIVKTPLPRVYEVEIDRFIVLFLLSLPFALLNKLDYHWLNPIATVLIAYPLLALDEIGGDLQNPFDVRNLGHLPLDEICDTIERNLMAMVETKPTPAAEGAADLLASDDVR